MKKVVSSLLLVGIVIGGSGCIVAHGHYGGHRHSGYHHGHGHHYGHHYGYHHYGGHHSHHGGGLRSHGR